MKEDQVSSTAILIARAHLLAEATPALRPLLLPEAAQFARRVLGAAGKLERFASLLKLRTFRRVLRAIEHALLPGGIAHWLARKLLLDELTMHAIEAGCRQLVVLGAGLDGLAWRMRNRAACFELDHPATQAVKQRAQLEGVTLLPLDLARAGTDAALRDLPGFDAARPSVFVAEGLLMYLPPARVAELFRELAAVSAPGSRFAFTFMEERAGEPLAFACSSRLITWWLRWRGEPFRWGLPRAEAESFVRAQGWRLLSLSSPAEQRARFLSPRGLGTAPLAEGETIGLAEISYDRAPVA